MDYRVQPEHVNLGIAIDLEARDGSRNLVVPNIKGVDEMNFKEFLYAYAELIDKARDGKLEISDFQETTISVTNPGTIGTVSSVPRLMKGGSPPVPFPAEYQCTGCTESAGCKQGRCTYDHYPERMFLQKVHQLL